MCTMLKKVFFEGVLCSRCNLWVHRKCAGLTNVQYKVLGNDSEEP